MRVLRGAFSAVQVVLRYLRTRKMSSERRAPPSRTRSWLFVCLVRHRDPSERPISDCPSETHLTFALYGIEKILNVCKIRQMYIIIVDVRRTYHVNDLRRDFLDLGIYIDIVYYY